MNAETEGQSYQPPELTVLGTLHELTLGRFPCIPVLEKTIGPPDYVNWIPVTTCSS
jgi:hypothetical protein